MNDTYVIGIDPGKNGGIAVMANGQLKDIYEMPSTVRELYHLLTNIFKLKSKGDKLYVYVENVHARPTDGRSSAFTFGYNVGVLDSCIGIASIRRSIELFRISPQTWTGSMGIIRDKKNKETKYQFKKRLLAYANERRDKASNQGLHDCIRGRHFRSDSNDNRFYGESDEREIRGRAETAKGSKHKTNRRDICGAETVGGSTLYGTQNNGDQNRGDVRDSVGALSSKGHLRKSSSIGNRSCVKVDEGILSESERRLPDRSIQLRKGVCKHTLDEKEHKVGQSILPELNLKTCDAYLIALYGIQQIQKGEIRR